MAHMAACHQQHSMTKKAVLDPYWWEKKQWLGRVMLPKNNCQSPERVRWSWKEDKKTNKITYRKYFTERPMGIRHNNFSRGEAVANAIKDKNTASKGNI